MPNDVKWCGSCGEGTVKADRPDCKHCGSEKWVNYDDDLRSGTIEMQHEYGAPWELVVSCFMYRMENKQDGATITKREGRAGDSGTAHARRGSDTSDCSLPADELEEPEPDSVDAGADAEPCAPCQFNYGIRAEIPWLLRKVLRIEELELEEDEKLDCSARRLDSCMRNITWRAGGAMGKWIIDEETQFEATESGTTRWTRKMTVRHPSWLPAWASTKIQNLYRSFTATARVDDEKFIKSMTAAMINSSSSTADHLERLGLLAIVERQCVSS